MSNKPNISAGEAFGSNGKPARVQQLENIDPVKGGEG